MRCCWGFFLKEDILSGARSRHFILKNFIQNRIKRNRLQLSCGLKGISMNWIWSVDCRCIQLRPEAGTRRDSSGSSVFVMTTNTLTESCGRCYWQPWGVLLMRTMGVVKREHIKFLYPSCRKKSRLWQLWEK